MDVLVVPRTLVNPINRYQSFCVDPGFSTKRRELDLQISPKVFVERFIKTQFPIIKTQFGDTLYIKIIGENLP